MGDIVLKMIPVSQCVLLRRNPQFLTPAQMDALKKSIARDGFVVPILVRPIENGRYEVVSGNHRLLAAQELGLEQVPAVVKDMDDREAQRLAINLNTVHGEPAVEALAPFLADLDDDLLREIFIPDDMLRELAEFDKILAEQLKELQAPDPIDSETPNTPVPTCTCPVCGKKHAPPV